MGGYVLFLRGVRAIANVCRYDVVHLSLLLILSIFRSLSRRITSTFPVKSVFLDMSVVAVDIPTPPLRPAPRHPLQDALEMTTRWLSAARGEAAGSSTTGDNRIPASHLRADGRISPSMLPNGELKAAHGFVCVSAADVENLVALLDEAAVLAARNQHAASVAPPRSTSRHGRLLASDDPFAGNNAASLDLDGGSSDTAVDDWLATTFSNRNPRSRAGTAGSVHLTADATSSAGAHTGMRSPQGNSLVAGVASPTNRGRRLTFAGSVTPQDRALSGGPSISSSQALPRLTSTGTSIRTISSSTPAGSRRNSLESLPASLRIDRQTSQAAVNSAALRSAASGLEVTVAPSMGDEGGARPQTTIVAAALPSVASAELQAAAEGRSRPEAGAPRRSRGEVTISVIIPADDAKVVASEVAEASAAAEPGNHHEAATSSSFPDSSSPMMPAASGISYKRTRLDAAFGFASESERQAALRLHNVPCLDIDDPEFDIFAAVDRFGYADSFVYVVLNVFLSYQFVDNLQLHPAALHDFLRDCCSLYFEENPYHNATHAADVVQTIHQFMLQETVVDNFDAVELFAMFFSATIHDVGHLGVSNAFLTRIGHPVARVFHNSPLESLHLLIGYALALRTKEGGSSTTTSPKGQATTVAATGAEPKRTTAYGFLSCLNDDQLEQFVTLVTHIVTGTDMRWHEDTMKTMGDVVGDGQIDDSEMKSVMRAVVHAADISNPMKPWKVYRKWITRVMGEFWQQGDEERRRGFVVPMMNDRHTADIAKAQMGFIQYIVKPLAEALSLLIPARWSLTLTVNMGHLKFDGWNTSDTTFVSVDDGKVTARSATAWRDRWGLVVDGVTRICRGQDWVSSRDAPAMTPMSTRDDEGLSLGFGVPAALINKVAKGPSGDPQAAAALDDEHVAASPVAPEVCSRGVIHQQQKAPPQTAPTKPLVPIDGRLSNTNSANEASLLFQQFSAAVATTVHHTAVLQYSLANGTLSKLDLGEAHQRVVVAMAAAAEGIDEIAAAREGAIASSPCGCDKAPTTYPLANNNARNGGSADASTAPSPTSVDAPSATSSVSTSVGTATIAFSSHRTHPSSRPFDFDTAALVGRKAALAVKRRQTATHPRSSSSISRLLLLQSLNVSGADACVPEETGPHMARRALDIHAALWQVIRGLFQPSSSRDTSP